MATLSATGSKGHHTFTLTVTETATSAINNTSTLSFTLTGGSSSYDFNWSSKSIHYVVTINGTSYTVDNGVYPKSQSWTILSKTGISVTHGSDGKKTINISFSVTDNIDQSYTTGNCSKSGTMALTNLDRSAPTITFNVGSITPNSFRISASANVACDTCQYKLNSGSWTDFTSTGKTISNLSENTSYTIQARLRKTSNHVYGYSTTQSVRTLKEQSPPNVYYTVSNVGATQFTLYAYSDVACDQYQYKIGNGNWTDLTSNGKTITGLTPNTTYNVQVRLRKTYNQVYGTSSTFTVTTVGGVLNVKINGTWHQGIPFVKVNGTWHQGIAYIKNNDSWEIGK